jgi:hypothetical protein
MNGNVCGQQNIKEEIVLGDRGDKLSQPNVIDHPSFSRAWSFVANGRAGEARLVSPPVFAALCTGPTSR